MEINMLIRGNSQEFKYSSCQLNPEDVLPLALPNGTNYAIGIDPSTTRTGIVIGNLTDYQADVFISLTRDTELDDTEFNKNIYNMFKNFIEVNHDKIQGISVEHPFKSKYTTNDQFAKQKANYNIWESLCNRLDVDFFKVAPASWRGTFTKAYGHLIKGDLRKVSKSRIRSIYAGRECPALMTLPLDLTDAYGIFKHHLAVNLEEYVASTSMTIEHRHKIFYVLTEGKNLSGFTEEFLKDQKKKYSKAKPIQFTYCPQLTPEENIRCFTSVNRDKKYNVYISAFYPNISVLRHLYKYRQTLPDVLGKDEILYIIGYKVN